MPHGSHAASRRVAARRRAWRGATFVSAVGGGLLFLTSWATSGGNEIRAASVTDLRTLVQRQRADTDAEVAKAAALADEVRTLSRSRGGAQVRRWQNEIDKVSPAAGLSEATGPGMTITLSDAPQSVVQLALKNGTPEIEKLVVHQQDIQAVINALWIGGATAVSVQDQRIISTTGIKCVGATVILHGVPYSPPYRIAAIGDPVKLQAAIDGSVYLDAYRQTAALYSLGYDATTSTDLTIKAYDGITKLRHATVATIKTN
jgi:uncharacterized protein YlxW (UPF0749 family)